MNNLKSGDKCIDWEARLEEARLEEARLEAEQDVKVEQFTNRSTNMNCKWTKYFDWAWFEKHGEERATWEASCGATFGGDRNDNSHYLDSEYIYCHKCSKPIQEETKEYEKERYETAEDPDEARMEVVRREWGNVHRI